MNIGSVGPIGPKDSSHESQPMQRAVVGLGGHVVKTTSKDVNFLSNIIHQIKKIFGLVSKDHRSVIDSSIEKINALKTKLQTSEQITLSEKNQMSETIDHIKVYVNRLDGSGGIFVKKDKENILGAVKTLSSYIESSDVYEKMPIHDKLEVLDKEIAEILSRQTKTEQSTQKADEIIKKLDSLKEDGKTFFQNDVEIFKFNAGIDIRKEIIKSVVNEEKTVKEAFEKQLSQFTKTGGQLLAQLKKDIGPISFTDSGSKKLDAMRADRQKVADQLVRQMQALEEISKSSLTRNEPDLRDFWATARGRISNFRTNFENVFASRYL